MHAKSTCSGLLIGFTLSVTVAQVTYVSGIEPADAPPVPNASTMTPPARASALAKAGGLIQAPVSGPTILLLNTQKQAPYALVNETASQIQKFVQLPCSSASEKGGDPLLDAVHALANTNHAAVIVICESKTLPSLLVAPESRWGIVNVTALGGANVTADKLADRLIKEIWRAYGYLMGAAHSSFEHCVLKPVLTPGDLDSLDCKTICPEPFVKIWNQAEKLGIKAIHMTTYRKAVAAGWAPAPTNEIQHAIWKELKQMPK
jgi:hypothetical protein